VKDHLHDIEKVFEDADPSTFHTDVRKKLAAAINELIETDFSQLVNLLYRVDVDEWKLKKLLRDNKNVDAGELIADLLIERQMQKIKSRRQSNRRDNNITEEDKW
jgi:2C-methyl-D-erythritol 2,4-cyclodiphosphate synthase